MKSYDLATPVPQGFPVYLGLTRRNIIAIAAMQGLCVSCGDSMATEEIASRAYEMADAMIEESEK